MATAREAPGPEDHVTRLGTRQQPAIVRVQTADRAQQIIALCNEHGIVCIVGVEPDQREDITDVERALKSVHADARRTEGRPQRSMPLRQRHQDQEVLPRTCGLTAPEKGETRV